MLPCDGESVLLYDNDFILIASALVRRRPPSLSAGGEAEETWPMWPALIPALTRLLCSLVSALASVNRVSFVSNIPKGQTCARSGVTGGGG